MRIWELLAAFERQGGSAGAGGDHIHPAALERFALNHGDAEERSRIENHIGECKQCRDSLEESHQFAKRLQAVRTITPLPGEQDRRQDIRYEIIEPAVITVTRPPEFVPADGLVMEVSRSGLRLSVQRMLDKGSEVRVVLGQAVVFGKVQYSREREDSSFDIGIEIEQVVLAGQRRKTVYILLVEDNSGDARLTQTMLESVSVPYQLAVASDGAQALEKLLDTAHPRPDLVLLDLNLPKVSGFEVLRRIRSEPSLCTLSVAVLSGSTAPPDVKLARELGVETYLEKPQEFEHYMNLSSRIEDLIMQAV